MNRTPVSSSQIKSVAFDAKTNTLEIEFKSGGGGIYQYANVTMADFEALIGRGKKDHSIGSHFFKNIKSRPDKFPYKKIEASISK